VEQNTERRSYYRIDDVIGLSYAKLDASDSAQADNHGTLGMPLTSLFAEIDREFNQATNTLFHENPTIAQALGLLNRKISLIAAHSLREQDYTVESYEEMMVSISGCGLAFGSNEELPVKTRLSLALTLKPADIRVDFTGEVVACEQQGASAEAPYWVRVGLDSNNPAAQEQLIQHIVQKQCAQIEPR